jgi:hypothetical protein
MGSWFFKCIAAENQYFGQQWEDDYYKRIFFSCALRRTYSKVCKIGILAVWPEIDLLTERVCA